MNVETDRRDRAQGAGATPGPVPDQPAPPAPRAPSPPPPPPRGVDQHIGASVAAAAAAANARRTRPEDGVLYVGMNADTAPKTTTRQRDVEASALRGMRRDAEIVTHGEDDRKLGPDRVGIPTPDGGTHVVDLGTPAGASAFAASLGLPKEQAARIAKVIAAASPGSRDELAGLAKVFARAERGEEMPGRLVLSGHSTGYGVYDGKDPDHQLFFGDVFALARAMPKAAAHIEDVMLSACSSGYETPDVEGATPLPAWREAFPNLKTAWGYGGGADYHSPSFGDAVNHLGLWERSTRGAVEDLDAAKVARGAAYAKNVATWSEHGAYRPGRR